MKTCEASRLTAAPAVIWSRWTRPETWPEHNDDLASASLKGPLAVGSMIRVQPKKGPWSALTITYLDTGRHLAAQLPHMVATIARLAGNADGPHATA
jgi:hypothetical protein